MKLQNITEASTLTYYLGLPVRGHWIRMYCEMKTVYAPFQILGLEHSKFLALVDND